MTEYERTHVLACGIANALGDDWTKETSVNADGEIKPWATLTHTDGYGLNITMFAEPWKKNNKPRVVVTGTYPTYTDTGGSECTARPSDLYNPRESTPEITVSAEKTPEQIAKDIERRFLPEYVAIWPRCKARADECNAYTDRKQQTRAALAAIPGVKMHGHVNRPEDTGTYNLRTLPYQWIDLRVTSATGIELKVNDLTPAQVSAIIDLLKK